MTASSHDLLAEALERRFEDGSRRVVLIMGAGFHHHLKSMVGGLDSRDDEWRWFTDWNGLLASIAEDLRLPVIRHEDPASTWESLIVRFAATRNKAAHVADVEASQKLSSRLRAHPLPTEQLQRVGRALRDGYRDIVSLNLDDVLTSAIESTNSMLERKREESLQRMLPTATWSHGGRSGRIWQPHGELDPPDGIVMGTWKYGKTLQTLVSSFDHAKHAERVWMEASGHRDWTPEVHSNWLEARRGTPPYEPRTEKGRASRLTWMDLFMSSDLVFVGTSLDRAETDLWWSLHQRLRNVARLSAGNRPRTFALFAAAPPGPPSHLMTAPAGVTPVIFEKWDEIWGMLLGQWWKTAT